MKKLLTLIFLSIISFNRIHAEITWTLSDDGTLTISGTDMPDYSDPDYAPWYSQRNGIKKLIIENGVTSIGDFAFYECRNLTSVTIANSVTSIGRSAFSHCCSLTSITIPNSVMNIKQYAFYGCSGLTSITIPNSVSSIGYQAFYRCTGLTSITVDKGNTYYDSRDNSNALIETESNTLIKGCNNTIIPNSVKSIEDWAFSGCSDLISVAIPNSVTKIGKHAFAGCYGLKAITIPNSIKSIGEYAFDGCRSLISATIPSSVTYIGESIFNNCPSLISIIVEKGNTYYDSRDNCNAIIKTKSNTLISGCKNSIIPNSVTSIAPSAFDCCTGLLTITFPKSVTSIGYGAFFGCNALALIICKANTPPSCSSSDFYDVKKSIPVYVPANRVNAYKAADGWKEFTNIKAITDMYALIDGDPYTNNSQYEGKDIFYTRNFTNTQWQALYIPFALNYDDWKDDFEVAYINGVRQLDKNDDGIIDETIMDVIKIKSGSTSPNMPYLIKAKTTGEKTFSVTNASLYPAEENSIDCSTTIAKYTFTGTYNTISSTTMIANKYYAMGGGQLITSDGSNDLKPYRWYMKVESRNPSYNASNAAKTITINVIGDEEEKMTTGIRQLQITNDELPVYDLNGRKVNENNLKPGIYVKNGKKFIVK